MKEKEMRKLLNEAKDYLKDTLLGEDSEFIKALISGNIESEEHKKKHERIKKLIDYIEGR